MGCAPRCHSERNAQLDPEYANINERAVDEVLRRPSSMRPASVVARQLTPPSRFVVLSTRLEAATQCHASRTETQHRQWRFALEPSRRSRRPPSEGTGRRVEAIVTQRDVEGLRLPGLIFGPKPPKPPPAIRASSPTSPQSTVSRWRIDGFPSHPTDFATAGAATISVWPQN